MKKKYRIENFMFFDMAGLEKHFNKMAKKGLLVSKCSNIFWTYEKIEPADLKFTVTYFHEASEFNPYPTANQEVFLEYCKESGWIFARDWAQMQIFYSKEENPTPIETDERLKLKNVNRSMWKNFLPSSLLLVALMIFQLLMLIPNDPDQFVLTFNNNMTTLAFLIVPIAGIMHLYNIISYYIWYFRSLHLIKNGGECLRKVLPYRFFHISLLIFILVALVILGFTSGIAGISIMLQVLLTIAVIFVVIVLRDRFKKAGMDAGANKFLTIAITVVLSIAISGIAVFIVILGIDEYNENQFENAPIVLSDFSPYAPNDGNYSHNESILLKDIRLNQWDDTNGALLYRVLEAKVDFVYPIIDDYVRDEFFQTHSKPIDPEKFSALEAYKEDDREYYTFFFEDEIIYIYFFDTPYTEEDLIEIVSILREF